MLQSSALCLSSLARAPHSHMLAEPGAQPLFQPCSHQYSLQHLPRRVHWDTLLIRARIPI